MCLLSIKPLGKQWNVEHLKYAISQNRDGWGLIGLRNGKMYLDKGMTLEELLAVLDFYQDTHAVFHARWATHGTKTIDQAHPYRVCGDIYMAHNGVFNIDTPDRTKSDTWHMARRLGSLGYDKLLQSLCDPVWIKAFGETIGANKVSFISPAFGIITVNEHLGHEADGVWLSNTSYKPYSYDRGGVSLVNDAKKPVLMQYDDAEDMLNSWTDIEDSYAKKLISADITTSPETALQAILLLIDRYRELESEALGLAPFGHRYV